MKTQQELLKALDYLYKLPPTKWDLHMISRFKRFVLNDLIMFVSKVEENKTEKTDPIERTKKNMT